MNAARFIVSGQVQGVWFRASARDQAQALGLRGYAKNLPDGRVEVLAVGDAPAIDTLAGGVGGGAALAHLEDLERLDAHEDEAGEGFVAI